MIPPCQGIEMMKKKIIYGIIFSGAICFLFIFTKHIIGEEDISYPAKMKMKRIERIQNSMREPGKYVLQNNAGEKIRKSIIAKIDEANLHNKLDGIQIASACVSGPDDSPFLLVNWIGDKALADHVVIDCGGRLWILKMPDHEIEENKKRETLFVDYESVIHFNDEIPMPDCLRTNGQVEISLAQGSKILSPPQRVIKSCP